jgi:hypothetical protein
MNDNFFQASSSSRFVITQPLHCFGKHGLVPHPIFSTVPFSMIFLGFFISFHFTPLAFYKANF